MASACEGCRNGAGFDRPFSMAFQPIVDLHTQTVFAHEALVRGPRGEGAMSVLSNVDENNRYAFDQACRVRALELASALELPRTGAGLSINFMPNAVYEPRACIRLTLEAAARTGFPLDQIIFEFTETERLDVAHVQNIVRTYKEIGFRTAIDDFGAGHAGLSLLARFQPDIVKIDMDLIRGIDREPVKRTIVRGVLAVLDDLGVTPLCEGIETVAELEVLRDLGVSLIQGYLFAKPAFEGLAAPALPDASFAAQAA